MKVFDILGMGFRNLLRRKTRTILTIVGVLIGATAIVIMLSLGIGMEEQMNRSLEGMGDLTVINVQANAWIPQGDDDWRETTNTLDAALLERIRTWDGIEAVSPFVRLWEAQLFAGRHNRAEWINLIGIDPSFIPYMRMNVERGHTPQPGDANFVLFGRRALYMFMDTRRTPRPRDWEQLNSPDFSVPPRVNVMREVLTLQGRMQGTWNPATQQVEMPSGAHRLGRHTLDQVGILEFDDSRGWDEHEWFVYVDYRVLLEIQQELERANRVRASDSRVGMFDEIRIKASDIATTELIMERLRDEEGIQTHNWMANMRDEMQGMLEAVQMLLGGIGAISLLVAAIGITNTMFMSIYERTKEIGVMKVLGCPLGGIQSMFLFEASIIGFLGGVFGAGLSLGLSMLVNRLEIVQAALGGMGGRGMMGMGGDSADISVIPLWLMLAAVVFSTLVGLVSGYLPSRRATKISALEAIRNE